MSLTNYRYLLALIVLTTFLVLLASCQPAATEAPQVEKTVVVTKEVQQEVQVEGEPVIEEVVATPTAAPAPTQPPTSDLPPSPVPTQPQPTQPPPTQPVPSPTPLVEERIVELEWPPRLRLGDSDTVRLALVPSEEGYTVTTEFPDHQTQTQPIQVERPGGYHLSAVARLDGVGFDISPQGEQESYLPLGETVTWHWTLTPRAPGQQRLTVKLLLRWTPGPGTVGTVREAVAYSRGLDVQVSSFFGMTRGQAMTGGLFGMLLGGGLSLFALVSLARPTPTALQTSSPNYSLVLEPRPGLSIPKGEGALLKALFRRYARLVLQGEFLSGYSGARTFLAQPIRPDGRADAYTIVKIGQSDAVRREFENYQAFVKDTLPPITARIQRPPVTVRGEAKAALQYTFIAEPGRMPTSLRQALLEGPDASLLTKLFETFGPNWWMQRRAYTFRLSQEYDRMLPTHYVLEPSSGRGKPLDGRAAPSDVNLAVGDLVTLRNFARVERRADGRSLSLKGTPQPGQPRLRARWLSLKDPDGATGRVVATRWTLLEDFISGFDLHGLPDPLARLPELLNESLSGTQSTIHGDLNLENVLVGPGDFVWLIDFAMTRDGHPLYDFAHLEAEIIAHVIAPQVASAEAYLAALRGAPSSELAPYYALREAASEIAGRCLFNASQPREYHLALYMACLGALKFANLEPFQKHLLYLTAGELTARL